MTLILVAGCGNQVPAPLPFPAAPLAPPSVIHWEDASYFATDPIGCLGMPYVEDAHLLLSVAGLPESSATVALTDLASGCSVPLNYLGPVTVGGQPFAYYGRAASLLFLTCAWGPQTGGNSYVMSSVTSAGTASATLVAPGPVSFSPPLGAGAGPATLITWTTEGNDDAITISTALPSTFGVGPDAVSPVAVPPGTYPSPPYSFGSIGISMRFVNRMTTIAGADATSKFAVGSYLIGCF